MLRPGLELAVLMWLGCGLAWGGEPRQLRLHWEDLDAHISENKVAFVLPDGTQVDGRVIRVERMGLRLKVTKTSDRGVLAKGERLVPRQSISVLRVTDYRRLGRLIGTLGALAAAGGIVAAQQIDLYEGPLVVIVPVVAAGGIAGSGVAGYFAGKAFDKRVTEILIVPDGKPLDTAAGSAVPLRAE